MSRFPVLAAPLALALGWSGTAAAGPMLTGSVTYDRATQLYTYSYTLDDRSAPAPVSVIEVRVATHVYDVFHRTPVSHTAGAPFTDFSVAEGGWDTAAFPGGTFYEWYTPVLSQAPGVSSGLSFTSRYGPAHAGVDNYTLFSSAVTQPPFNRADGFVEYGRVVAPDLTAAPEPGALALGIVGLAAIGLRRLQGRARFRRSAGR